LDAGLRVPHSEEILPAEERIKGEHIAEWAAKLAEENPDFYQRQFSKYLKRGLKPEDLPSHFEEVKSKIVAEYAERVGAKVESQG
jgi:large subunit ribosomal protein L18